MGIIKSKRNSIKKKVQNFSHESDDAVIEPLLQKDKDKSGISNSSAKHLLSKGKTDSSDDKDKLLSSQMERPSLTTAPSAIAGTSLMNGTKGNNLPKTFEHTTTTIHNHMHTNVFSSLDKAKSTVSSKSQILVEIDGNKPTSYNPSPLIFTTAKIHADGKTKHMEPVQVTPVPILSTIEGSLVKMGNISAIDKISSGSSSKSNNVLNAGCIKSNTSDIKVPNEQPFSKPISELNNASCSGFSSTSVENNTLNESKKASTSNFSANDCSKPVISVGVNIILPAKTIKSETIISGTTLVDLKNKSDHSVGNIIKIDMNKNIQSMSSLGQSSSTGGTHSDINGFKHLQHQKTATVEDSDKDKDMSIASVDSLMSNGNKRCLDIIGNSQSNSKLKHTTDPDKSSVGSTITLASPATYSSTSKTVENIISSNAKTAISTPISESNTQSPGITPNVTSTLSSTVTVTPITKNTVTTTNEYLIKKSAINPSTGSGLSDQITEKVELGSKESSIKSTSGSSEVPKIGMNNSTNSSIIVSTVKSAVKSDATSISTPIALTTTSGKPNLGTATTLTSMAKPKEIATTTTIANTIETPTTVTSADKNAVSEITATSLTKSVLTTTAAATSKIITTGIASAVTPKIATSTGRITTTTKSVKPIAITTSAGKTSMSSTVTLPASKSVTTAANSPTTAEKSAPNTALKQVTSTVKPSLSSASSSAKSSGLSKTEVKTNSSLKSLDPISMTEKSNMPKVAAKSPSVSVLSGPQAVTTISSNIASPKATSSKTQDNSIQSGSSKSTGVAGSKSIPVSTKQSTSATKQISDKSSTWKQNSSIGNSVKTLITSNDKSTKSSGPANSAAIATTSASSTTPLDSKINDHKNSKS